MKSARMLECKVKIKEQNRSPTKPMLKESVEFCLYNGIELLAIIVCFISHRSMS